MANGVVKKGSVWYCYKRINGKLTWFSANVCGFPNTEKGAKVHLAKISVDLAEESYVEPTKLTVAEYAERWMKDAAPRKCGPKSLELYRYLLDCYIKPGLGDCRIAVLKPLHIEEFYSGLKRSDGRETPLSSNTKQAIHRLLSTLLNHAVEMEVLSRSPLKKGLAPEGKKGQVECYDREQVKEILILARQSPIYPAVVVAVYTGMRVGEICALRWEDVNFDAKTITITRSIQVTAGATLREKDTKTGKGRTVTVSDFVLRVLGRMGRSDGYVIGGNPENLSKAWMWLIREKSPIPYKHFHTLRHTHASLLIEQGEHPKTISSRLGHSSINITMDRYGHLFKGLDEKAAEKLDQVLSSG